MIPRTVWQISHGADKRPIRSWGVRAATLTRRSFGRDELALTAPALAIGAAPLWPQGATIVLWRNGARYFTGRMISPEVYGSAQGTGHTYVAAGPWWYLENIVYQEERFMATDPTAEDSPLVRVFSSRAVLFAALNGTSQTTATQAAQAINFARGRGMPAAVGTLGIEMDVPWEEANDVTPAEVVKRSCRWAPDAVQWCGYSSATPTINIASRDALTAETIDLDDRDLVQSFSIRPMHEERVPGVRFFFEDFNTLPSGKTKARYTQQSAGAPDAFGAIVAVIERGGVGSANPEPLPADLAAAFYARVSTLNHAGTLVLKQRDVDGRFCPSKVLRAVGGGAPASWATMDATIQSSAENLFSGETQVQFGQSPFLGVASFVEYLRFQRLRSKSSYLESRITGEGNTSATPPRSISYFGSGAEGVGEKGFVDIPLCGDSATGAPPITFRVWGQNVTPEP